METNSVLGDFRLEDSFGYLISTIKVRMAAALDRELAGLDITHAQWVILMRIAAGMGQTCADLCRGASYDTGSMTRMLDRLEEKQLVKRERSLEDRRVIEICLTDHGCELLPRLREIGERVLSRLVQGFDVAEEDLCRGLLRRMADNLVEARPVGDPAHAPAAKP